MNPFIFQSATKIIFGEQTVYSICDVIRELGGTKPVIITDANLVKAGILKPILESLESGAMAAPLIFDEVPMDSDIQCVQKVAAAARAQGCDCVIAIGGGSVMDTAKAANICLTYGGTDLLDYLGLNCLPSKLLPLVAIPTTAGTGSEVSLIAMIKDHENQTKLAFGSIYLAPNVAILDPTLIVSLPPKLTAATGIDALTHAIECFVALITVSPFTDALCLESMRLIFQYLERATTNGADLEARGNTLVASCMAGLAFTNAGVGIVHAMAHATGARFGTHHGMTNAVYLPYGMEFNLVEGAARFAQAARYIGISQSANDNEAALKFIEAVRDLTGRCGLPTRLKDLGVPVLNNSELEELAMLASTDPAIMFNPKESSLADIIGIYERAY